MDKRVFRMAILTIISAFLLVLVIVYAANTEKINKLFGWGQTSKTDTSEVAASYYSGDYSEYGQQIGSDLDGFLADQEFFDETEKIPSVVVIKKSSSSADSSENATLGSTQEQTGTGMAVVGELVNPNGQGVDPSTLDASLFQYNGEMPQTPPPGGTPPGGTAGTPVGTVPGN